MGPEDAKRRSGVPWMEGNRGPHSLRGSRHLYIYVYIYIVVVGTITLKGGEYGGTAFECF